MQKTNYRSDSSSFAIPGWNQYWEDLFVKFEGPYHPGRVCTVHKTRYEVIIPGDIISVPASGAMISKKIFPVVGDFVVVLNQPESATRMIVAILPRKTSLSRGGAGESAGKQVLAANIDTVFIVTEPESDLSISRLERYLLITRSSGARPVIILNKSDTSPDIAGHRGDHHGAAGDGRTSGGLLSGSPGRPPRSGAGAGGSGLMTMQSRTKR